MVATAESAQAQAQRVGVAPRVAPPSTAYAVSRRQSQNASPSRQAILRPSANPEQGYPGYVRMEDLMRENHV